jgi:hypothetical protein
VEVQVIIVIVAVKSLIAEEITQHEHKEAAAHPHSARGKLNARERCTNSSSTKSPRWNLFSLHCTGVTGGAERESSQGAIQ